MIDPPWVNGPPESPPEDTIEKLKRQVHHIGYLNYELAQAEWRNSILNKPDVALASAQGSFEKLLDMALTEAYADGRRDESEEFAKLLPGPYYMDPPDGGSVTILEQFQRMAEDARKWREQEERIRLAIECERRCEG